MSYLSYTGNTRTTDGSLSQCNFCLKRIVQINFQENWSLVLTAILNFSFAEAVGFILQHKFTFSMNLVLNWVSFKTFLQFETEI